MQLHFRMQKLNHDFEQETTSVQTLQAVDFGLQLQHHSFRLVRMRLTLQTSIVKIDKHEVTYTETTFQHTWQNAMLITVQTTTKDACLTLMILTPSIASLCVLQKVKQLKLQ